MQSERLPHPNSVKPETGFAWQKFMVIDVKEGDRYLHLTPSFKFNANTDFRLDAAALVPQE
jgi:hypothetical protein